MLMLYLLFNTMYILINAISLLSLVKGEAELRRHNGQGCTVMTVGDRGVRWEVRGVRREV